MSEVGDNKVYIILADESKDVTDDKLIMVVIFMSVVSVVKNL